MCGIVGYCGYQNAANIVINGLKALEYRGYDSAGIALCAQRISLFKHEGRVRELEQIIPLQSNAHTAIGHTRWATHGKPIARNAHPHLSQDGQIAIVHNGVIENCDELRSRLLAIGIKFTSDTDSEIIAQLLSLEDTSDMLSAVKRVSDMLKGAATFLAVKSGEDKIYCNRRGASLAIGLGKGETFVASDTLAISSHTQDVLILSDGEYAQISAEGAIVYKDGKQVRKQPVMIDRQLPSECSCYMRSEIDEIPAAMLRTYESFLGGADNTLCSALRKAKTIYITGCGTAYHAGLYGKEAFEQLLGIPCHAVIASEFDRVRFLDENCAVLLISQSGETADTLYAMQTAKAAHALTVAITNVKGSTITFDADYTLLLDAGAEIAVAATKSYNCQLYALYLLANRSAGIYISPSKAYALSRIVEEISSANLYEEKLKTCNLFFIGKGLDSVTAQEGALKFKEITCKMTDAYAAGELKHGTIALIDERACVIVIATNAQDKHRIEATVCELRSRGAYTISISAVGDVGADKTLTLPILDDNLLYPLISVVPLQNLALTSSLCLGLNPDKPRNLAKSVTVI